MEHDSEYDDDAERFSWFEFEGKKYVVSTAIVREDAVIGLPDGRKLRVVSWYPDLCGHPPQPQELRLYDVDKSELEVVAAAYDE